MKIKGFLAVMLVCALWCIGASATTYDPYVVRSDVRTAEATVGMLEGSPYFWQFQVELQKNTGLQFGHLTRAVELGILVTKLCGTCELETAGIRKGESVYHRHVRPEEPVAYLGEVPVFLPACGNPTRLLKSTVTPKVLPPAPPPPPVARKEKPVPKPKLEGCTDGTVQYTTGYWEHPNIYGFWSGGSGGGFSWVTSHHAGMTCTWEHSDSDGDE